MFPDFSCFEVSIGRHCCVIKMKFFTLFRLLCNILDYLGDTIIYHLTGSSVCLINKSPLISLCIMFFLVYSTQKKSAHDQFVI